jgi:hypothetical protein
MNRENNTYISEVGEILNATQMVTFVKAEAKRQYEECSGEKFEDMPVDYQYDCYLDQFKHQLNNRGWKVILG